MKFKELLNLINSVGKVLLIPQTKFVIIIYLIYSFNELNVLTNSSKWFLAIGGIIWALSGLWDEYRIIDLENKFDKKEEKEE